MPLYEYECEPQKHRFERIQKFSDPPIDTCPVCGGPVRKLLSSPAIQFKGSGFYITDYPKSSSGGGASSKSSGSSESSGGKGEKGESSSKTSDSSASSSSSSGSSGDSKKDSKKE